MSDSSSRPLKVFLCHASGDKQVLRELYRQLNAEGWVDVWLDEVKLLPGQEWDLEIEKAVEDVDIVLVCLSTRSVDKEGYVQKELRFVLNIADEKPEGSIFVIPLRLDDCVVPRRLRHWQYVDYFPASQKSIAYQRLLESFKVRARKLGISLDKLKAEPAPKPFEKAPFDLARDKPTPVVVSQKQKMEKTAKPERESQPKLVASPERLAVKKVAPSALIKSIPWRLVAGIAGGLTLIILCIWGSISIWNNLSADTPEPTQISQPTATRAFQPVATHSSKSTKTSTPSPTKLSFPPTPTLAIGSTMTGKDGMTLLYVPSGKFIMGQGSGWWKKDETMREHTVYLDAFWIDQTEVTNAMYAKCVNDGKCNSPRSQKSSTRDSYFDNKDFDDYPVLYVTWDDAKTYCLSENRRLPTEAEWEKAARGDDARFYPWGDSSPDKSLLNYGSFVGDTTNVGNYPIGASPYGALDMAGNVLEWVGDWYREYYYASSPASNPPGPDLGTARVLRGSSWRETKECYWTGDCYSNPGDVFLWLRQWDVPSKSNDYYGFRCAMSATP